MIVAMDLNTMGTIEPKMLLIRGMHKDMDTFDVLLTYIKDFERATGYRFHSIASDSPFVVLWHRPCALVRIIRKMYLR